jgi:hypothetical protein
MTAEKKQAHTPGPWATGSTVTRVQVWPEGWNVPLCIADCHTKNAPENKAERVANARLIAAAPDLLAIVERLNYAFYVDGTAKALRPIMAETKAILARVRGSAVAS